MPFLKQKKVFKNHILHPDKGFKIIHLAKTIIKSNLLIIKQCKMNNTFNLLIFIRK
jgi:hypothetical protein